MEFKEKEEEQKRMRKLIKVACGVKTNATWTTRNTTSSHYFSKKIKSITLQGHKRYMKIFQLETNYLRI